MVGSKDILALESKAKELRRDVILMLTAAGSGHTGGSLGMADIFSALYFKFLNVKPKNPNWSKRDYLFLSNGHICPILYASLAHADFFKLSELENLRKIDSLLQGHPHNVTIPGVENSSGPLGQGISMAVGAAASLQRDEKENRVVSICGDGELNEGQCWEAFQLAAKEKLSNFTLIVDYNKIQLDGLTQKVMPMGNLKNKFETFGFNVFEMDGNDMKDVVRTLEKVLKSKTGPKVILAHTFMGKGVSFMQGDYHWHGKAPSIEEAKKALEELK